MKTAQTQDQNVMALSSDPAKAMQEMMESIDTLRRVYAEENEALENADTSLFVNLQDRKIKAAQDYQARAAQIIERREELKSHIDRVMRERLHAMQADFSSVTQTNLTALDRMRRSAQRLSDRIMIAARDIAVRENMKYGVRGKLENNMRRVSIGLNESA